MNHVPTTQLDAFRKLDAADQYNAILGYLRSISPTSSCIADIAHALGMERSTVSARLNELKNHTNKLTFDGKRPSQRTGITAMHWKVLPQDTLF
jgi:uncharacterized protein YidB (DUF937 family)